MGYHDYVSSTILFAIMVFFIGYLNPLIGSRKLALLFPALFFPSIVLTPPELMPQNFVWQVFALFCISIAFMCCCALFIFPNFASIEIQDRFCFILQGGIVSFDLAMKAMMACHKAEASAYLCELDIILKNILQCHEIIGIKLLFALYEPHSLVRRIFRSHQSVINQHPLSHLQATSSSILWHITCLVDAINKMNYSLYHAQVVEKCRVEFLDVSKKFQNVLECCVNESRDRDSDLQTEGKMTDLIAELKRSCDAAYKSFLDSLMEAEGIAHEASEISSSSIIQQDEYDAKKDMDKDVDKALAGLTSPIHYVSYDKDAHVGPNRITASYFFFHVSELTRSLEHNFCSRPASTPKPFVLAEFLKECYLFFVNYLKSFTLNFHSNCLMGIRMVIIMGIGLIFVELPIMRDRFQQGEREIGCHREVVVN